jgi:hypothetical protein
MEVLLAWFERFLLSERGLGAGTGRGYVRHARWFLQARGAEDVSGLTARDVTAAVLCMAGSGVSASAARYFTCPSIATKHITMHTLRHYVDG